MATHQITVRIHEDRVRHLDAAVEAGLSKSRAAYIDRLIERDMRRARDAADLEKILATGPDVEVEAIREHVRANQRDLSHLD